MIRRRYGVSPVNAGVFALMRRRVGEVDGQDVGVLEEQHLLPSWHGINGVYRRMAELFMESSGYARRLSGSRTMTVPGEAGSWWLPALHRWDIDHFLRDSFAQHHLFSEVAGLPSVGSVITFCEKGRRKTGVQGRIHILPDGSVESIEWQFILPAKQQAAGWVDFLSQTFEPRRLIPTRSLFWIALPGKNGLYYQDAATYQAWTVSADSTIPARWP
jgi:hypothetical protein